MIPGQPRSILIVEDERIVAKDIQQTLCELGYDAFAIASSSDEAISRASERCPDLVLMDIHIKGQRDGIETAEVLRTQFGVPVLYLTAHADDRTLERAKVTGPYGYLLKPVRSVELRTAIEVSLHRHGLETRLRASEAQLQQAQAIAHIGSWDFDPKSNRVTRSLELCRILGLPDDEALVTTDANFDPVHPEDRARVHDEVAQAISNGEPWVSEYRIVRRDGVRFIVARGESIRDASGSPIRMFGTSQDVTEKKQTEARLVLADRLSAVGTMAAGVGHEINNPLAYVMANLDLIAEEVRTIGGGSPSGRLRDLLEMVNDARQGAERVRTIVRGLRTFARIEEERRVTLDVKHVLDLSINMTLNEIRHRARLVKDYGSVPPVDADEGRLGQVFINLLVNAAQSIPEGHVDRNEIRLTTRTDASGMAVIEVRDTGHGIRRDALGRIFDPFYTTKAIGEGTGLGLSICHGIVTALGGTIAVESEVGSGTVFRVALPAASPEPSIAEARRDSLRPGPGRRGRVLIVDDDETLAKVLRRALGTEHDVTTTAGAMEAMALLTSGPPFDVILCDLMMPEMTGMTFHAEVSQGLGDMADRMIFMSGGAFTPSARDFLDQVPNQRFEKPFDMQTLRAAIRGFLR